MNEEYVGLLTFQRTAVLDWLLNSPCRITAIFTGNQFGKTDTVSVDYTLRFMGMHPNPSKNIKSTDAVRTVRFASHTLPSEKEETEVRNTQYPALKRRIPPTLIKGDITVRKPVVTINTSDNGTGQIEFVSFSQEVQAGAGVQRRSCWIDEESNKDFFEEQIPRLMAADGDLIMTFTPVQGAIGWEFDELYERAKYIYRTKAVRDRIKKRFGEDKPELEVTDSEDDICVIMAATDDNPIYDRLAAEKTEKAKRDLIAAGKPELAESILITKEDYIDALFNMYDDEDVIDARRFGIFRQLSGKIYKSFSHQCHVISREKYFPEGIPHEWKHFRGIDYHESNAWAVVWVCVSPSDEIFVYCDYAPSPQKLRTWDIANNIAFMSGDYRFLGDRIDPHANIKQVSTNLTTVEDLNRYFHELKNQIKGFQGGYWEGWDTKGTRGREELTKRLLNSIKVGKPNSNRVLENGYAVTLPTIWFLDNCKYTIEAMKSWRREDWKSREMLMSNEPKEKPQEKWSHFPITIECLLKDPALSNARWGSLTGASTRPKHYLTGAR